jgi:membrane peptidoglycan carboxypeptidase
VFSEKQVIYVPYSNNGSFPSGVVSFDLTSLANQSKWLDLQQSFISIPVVIQLKSTTGSFSTANVENAFAMSLNNHVFRLLQSISLEIAKIM